MTDQCCAHPAPRPSLRLLAARRRPGSDDGVAAVEFALLISVVLAVVALVAPLSYLFYERVQLGRAAGDTIRFATSRSDTERSVTGMTGDEIRPGDLPSEADVAGEASRAGTGRKPTSLSSYQRSSDSSCPSGNRLQITLTTTVDVGPFAGLLIDGNTRTLTASATSCEE